MIVSCNLASVEVTTNLKWLYTKQISRKSNDGCKELTTKDVRKSAPATGGVKKPQFVTVQIQLYCV